MSSGADSLPSWIKNLKKERNRTRKTWQKTWYPPDKTSYHRANAAYRKAIKQYLLESSTEHVVSDVAFADGGPTWVACNSLQHAESGRDTLSLSLTLQAFAKDLKVVLELLKEIANIVKGVPIREILETLKDATTKEEKLECLFHSMNKEE